MGIAKLFLGPRKGHDDLTSGSSILWGHLFSFDILLADGSFREESSLEHDDQELMDSLDVY